MVFRDRQALRLAVDGGGRAEDQLLHADRAHRLEQAQRAVDVAVVVDERLLAGFADRLQPGEMDDRRAAVAAHHRLEEVAVADVAALAGGRTPGDLLDAGEHLGMAVVEIVDDDDVAARLEQLDHRVRADIAGAAGNQDRHCRRISATPGGELQLYDRPQGFNADRRITFPRGLEAAARIVHSPLEIGRHAMRIFVVALGFLCALVGRVRRRNRRSPATRWTTGWRSCSPPTAASARW
jgi:hypothetical protein